MLRIRGRILRQRPGKPLPALFWAAGYSFSFMSLLCDVPYDPGFKFLFFGEEMAMLARMWTGNEFRNVLTLVTLHRKYTCALTFENV